MSGKAPGNAPGKTLRVGKLPPTLLASLLSHAPQQDPRIVLGPGIGLDCAVVDGGDSLWALKSDPITFASEEIGWYAVQVNANDIATSGASPRWLLMTLLLPEGSTAELAKQITHQVYAACREIGVAVIGGHTEISHGIDHPILAATLIGEVRREALVTPRGACAGDRILLTKWVPIEATAILAREFPNRLRAALDEAELEQASGALYHPGISVLRDARLAVEAGRVSAMHDPTEGGLVTALWELAEASGRGLQVDLEAVPISELARRICAHLGLDPLGCIASGALLLTAPPGEAEHICQALQEEGIACTLIGVVEEGPATVWRKTAMGRERLPRIERDEIAKLFDG